MFGLMRRSVDGTAEPRTVVITGASRGLGLATAAWLYRQGWHVVAAMRTPDVGMARLRAVTGAAVDDPRLTGVRLDVTDPASVEDAVGEILAGGEAPFGLVHNAGVVSVGCAEELPFPVFEQIFATNVFGAARLTAALLPSMRAAGQGRLVVISSEGAVHGMPAISAYSASKGALERWAEAVALEVAPFGIGVSVLVAGTFDTDIIDRDHTVSYGDPEGPYRHLHAGQARMETRIKRIARPPERFGPAVARALDERAPFTRRAVGPDAVALRILRALLPAGAIQRLVAMALGIPRPGALRDDPIRATVLDGERNKY
jgi:NAD(P)-dependent dehydrogenase (short-subunit alcohol dehydrogenase family)